MFFAIIVFNVQHCWVGGWQDVGRTTRRRSPWSMFRKKCNQACHFIGFFFLSIYHLALSGWGAGWQGQRWVEGGRLGWVDMWNICGRKKKFFWSKNPIKLVSGSALFALRLSCEALLAATVKRSWKAGKEDAHVHCNLCRCLCICL